MTSATRVYHDAAKRVIVVENDPNAYPEGSLAFTDDGTQVSIWGPGGQFTVLGPVPFSEIAREDGTPFSMVGDCRSYLLDHLNRRYSVEATTWQGDGW